MASGAIIRSERRSSDDVAPIATLRVSWPWWLHPAWALLLLTGTTALLSVVIPSDSYQSMWRVPKYLEGDLPLMLVVCVVAMLVGILVASGAAARGGEIEIGFTERQIHWLRRGYRFMFALTLVGYAVWIASAAIQGVGVAEVMGVLNRADGAIGDLKESSRPIGGVTTLTQFGPLVVVLGYVLRRVAGGGRWFYWLVVLTIARMLFYAERLAVIEVVLPLLLVAALTSQRTTFLGRLIRVGPILAGPMLWAVFAISEYNRSWIYYQQISPLPFHEWVTLRLVGYYTTSFNNSALLATELPRADAPPYFIATGFWSAPGIEQIVPHPGIGGVSPEEWWSTALAQRSNPEFTNVGSFLSSVAEIGIIGSTFYWLVTGLVIGAIFTSMTRGSLPAMLATVTLFIGVLELPRLIYWSLGRSIPFVAALVFIALFYPRQTRRRGTRHTLRL